MKIQFIYKDKTRPFPIDNVFGIEDSSMFDCRVHEYTPLNNYLDIAVIDRRKPQKSAYLIGFSSTLYFNGPFEWVGANFCVASPQECLEIIRKFDAYNTVPEDTILENYTLFTVTFQKCIIKLLAVTGYLKEIPPPKGYSVE